MKKKIGIIVFLLCLCFNMMIYHISAASTSDAVEPIIPEKECSLNVSYCSGETVFYNMEIRLYRIADVSADFKYTLTKGFEASGLILEGIRTAGEWNVVRSTLEAYILADKISPEFTSVTNGEGLVSFEGLKAGMYLAIVGNGEQNDTLYRFDSALVALPGLDHDGYWQYQVSVNAKGEALPPIDPDEKKELSVLKLWRGDEGRSDRPKSIEVEIFCDGISYKTVILSEENRWTYSWPVKDDGSKWTVIERNVPQDYTMTVEERSSTFVLTNTRTPEYPDDPVTPPPTGDTSNVLLYALLMIGSGSMLIIVGITGKRSRT